MLLSILLLFLFSAPSATTKQTKSAPDDGDKPAYTAKGELKFPENYREWVFLTSGIDMSYSATENPSHSVFDNVFVNPSAHKAFRETGTWPDKTVLVLEVRGAEGAASINKRGHTQAAEVMQTEVHVKDLSKGGWTFYGFNNSANGHPFERSASCYSCHQDHAAVDTTFVQFYPTLYGRAKEKGTLSAEHLKELTAQKTAK
jgi:hypothetical protein